MQSSSTSYDYSKFEKENTELKRLKLQAKLAQDIERKVLIQRGLKQDMDVLDIGCGPGFITNIIAEIACQGSVTGIDANQDLLGIAQSNLKSNPKANLNFQQGNIYDLESMNKKFDFIYCRFVLQHLDNKEKALEQIYAVLKPGGRALIVDVDDSLVTFHPPHETLDQIFLQQQNYQKQNGGDRFVGRKLFSLMSTSGFTEVDPQVLTFSSEQLGMRNFISLITGYKLIFLQNSEQDQGTLTQAAVEDMYQSCSEGGYFGTVGVFHVLGKKE